MNASLMIFGMRSIIHGVFEFLGAQLWREIQGEWWLTLSDSVAISRPCAGILALVWLIETPAVVFGVAMIMPSLRLRKLAS